MGPSLDAHRVHNLNVKAIVIWTITVLSLELFPDSGSATILCYAAAIYALRGPKQTAEAFLFLALLTLMGRTGGGVARWLVLFSGFLRVVWDTAISQAPIPRIVWILSLFAGSVVFFAPLTSTIPTVSVLKAITFWTGVSTMMVSFYRTRHLHDYWLSLIVSFGIFLIAASFIKLLAGGGYERNNTGFQGILSHPQTFGPAVASIAALFTGLLLFRNDRRWFVILGSAMAWAGVFMSLARTALLAAVLALALTVVASSIKGFQIWHNVRGYLLRPSAILIYIGMFGLLVLNMEPIQARLESFLIKRGSEQQTVGEALRSGRESKIVASLDNFFDSPLTGIGFGVPSSRSNSGIEEGALGLPTAAPTEKGFMPTAVLEETGVTGAILVFILLVNLLRPIWRSQNATLIWVTLAALLINLGEMVFFSVGGMGIFLWFLMSYAHTNCGHAVSPPRNDRR